MVEDAATNAVLELEEEKGGMSSQEDEGTEYFASDPAPAPPR